MSMDASVLKKKCFKYFEFQPRHIDKAMTVILKRIVLDIYELDDFLHYKHGNYENKGFSMESFIESEYGKEAHDFTLEAFGLKFGK